MEKLTERTWCLMSVIYWLTSQEPLAFWRSHSTTPSVTFPLHTMGLFPVRLRGPVNRAICVVQWQHFFPDTPESGLNNCPMWYPDVWKALGSTRKVVGIDLLSFDWLSFKTLCPSLLSPGRWERLPSSSQSYCEHVMCFVQQSALRIDLTDVVHLVPLS